MKNACVTVEFDTEKMGALKIYLEQKQTTIEEELSKELMILYEKNVPAGVRTYIDLRGTAKPKERKPKAKPPKNDNFPSDILFEETNDLKEDDI